jgi:(p)ppGpp synthase/HD superfamily hydrolase
VKFADRIHNLSTQWNPSDTATVRRKVDETKEYFLDIAKETNSKAYHSLQSLILQLEIQLNNAGERVEKVMVG